ncbi:AraC family transcriptional regulator [uncultured Winogradskyella sp.]|uniref:helix-turn-helix domain-containing protein n=1 Tax=uncultured Winogradskyella sp. TaxID=395353 RepID=UPI00262878C1|nr:AraC family transcriptional regulator [uncultured Winogradskyella sp.]
MEKKIDITDFEASNIVIDMAKSLGIEHEVTNKNEYCLRIPSSVGSGYVKAYNFDHGVSVIETDYLLKDDLVFELQRGVIHPLKIIFNRESSFYHKFKKEESFREIKTLQSLMVSSTLTDNHMFKIPANESVSIFSIEINRKLFEKKIEDFLSDMNDELVELFRDVNGIKQFIYIGNYSINVSETITEFTESELEGFMRSVSLEGKAYDVLTSHIQQYIDDLNSPNKRKILRQATIERLKEAVEIIENEIDTVDNIDILAKRVGINQNTLQRAFKSLYNSSIKEYITNHRIEKAKELLETTDLNITEITYKIGINSRSYFSKIFKKRYGLTPKAYKFKIRQTNTG